MATPYADLLVRFRADKKDFDSKARDVDQSMGMLGRGAKIAGAAIAGLVTREAVQGLISLAAEAGKVAGSMSALQSATGNAAGSLEYARRATRGLINDYDLAVGLTRSLTLGTASNAVEFGKLAETAITLGRAMGLDAAFALERLNTGLSRQSSLLLDDLGIVVDVTEANKKYADSVGKNVSELSAQQRSIAFNTAAFEAMEKAMETVGEANLTMADQVNTVASEWANLRVTFGRFINENTSLKAELAELSEFLNDINQKSRAAALGISVIDLKKLGDVAALTTIEQLTFALNSVNRQINEIPQSIQNIESQLAAGAETGFLGLPKNIQEQVESYRALLLQQDAIQESLRRLNETAANVDEAVIFNPTKLQFSIDTAQRLVDALEAAKEAVAGAEFADALNPSDETRKNLEEARAELERILNAAKEIGGLSAIEILLEVETQRKPPGSTRPRQYGPGTFATDEELGIGPDSFQAAFRNLSKNVPKSAADVSSMFKRLISSVDLSNMLETALGGLLTGGITSLAGIGIGFAGRLFSGMMSGGMSQQERTALANSQQELAAALDRNKDVIEENTKAVLGGAFGQITGTDFSAILAAIEILRGPVPEGDRDGRGSEEEAELERAYAEAAALIAKIAEQYEIAFDWSDIQASLDEFQRALLSTVYSLETFNAGFDFLQRQFALLDIDDTATQFEMAIEFMAGLVGDDLAATLLGMIDNVGDFDAFIESILAAIQDPDSFIQLMGDLEGVTITEFLNWLGYTESALDRLEESASDAAEALRNVPTGFKYALSVFQASDPVQRSASSTSDLVMGMGATGGGMTVNISVNGAGNPSEVAQAVAKEFRREYERGGYGNQRLAGIGR